MSTIIKIKTSGVNASPASPVKVGEFSYSYVAGTQANGGDRLYVGVGPIDGNGDATINHVIGGKYFTALIDHVPGTLTASSGILVDANKAIDEIIIGNSSSVGGSIKLNEATSNGSEAITIKAPNALTTAYTLTLPTATGTPGQFLKTDGSGNLAFETIFSSFTITGDTGSDTFNTNETLDFNGSSQIATAVGVVNNRVDFSIINESIGTNQLTNAGVTNAKLANTSVSLGAQTLTLGAAATTDLSGITSLVVDDITINGQSITTTASNKDITLTPHGTGTVVVPSGYKDRAGFTDNSLANKAYVDSVSQGLDVKNSVVIATTQNIDNVTYNNGTAGVGATLTYDSPIFILAQIDGVTPTIGDRILIKNQTNAAHNGIYTYGAGDVFTRAIDADTSSDLSGGVFVFVEQGTLNADNGYVFTHNGAPTIGTTNLPVSQFSGAGQITAGAALTKSGNQLDVAVDNSSIEITTDALNVKALGITNAMLAGSIATSKLASPFFFISDETSTVAQINLNQTLRINAGEGIDTTISGNTINIIGELATASNAGVAFFPTYNSGTGLGNFVVTSGSVQISTIDGGTY
jgi:hypothetical protein